MRRTVGLARFLLSSWIFLLPILLPAQATAKWMLSLEGGPALYRGDVSKETVGTFQGKTLTGGAGIHYRIANNGWIRLAAHRGELKGADEYYTFDLYRLDRNFEFSTQYTDISIGGLYQPWPTMPLQPYIGVGVGLLFYEPNAFLLNNTHLDLADFIKLDLEAVASSPAVIVPISIGISYRFSNFLSSQLGFDYNLTTTDLLDGVSWSGNPGDMDRYGLLKLGLNFHINLRRADIDEDGIADEEDECPYKPGNLDTGGCPDKDGDGLRDSEDQCPLAAGTIDMYGCPDTDEDGTADPYDRCPAMAGPPESLGCPALDTDMDGTQDHLDECPLVAGPPGRRGCPAIDTDGDGILDEDDHCPEHYGPPLFDGCPDSDGDGIEDIKDACPSSFGSFDNQGCPSAMNAQEEAILLSDQQLHFRPKNADLINFPLLDKLATFLKIYPDYRVLIIGHADGYGSEDAFNYLSQLRAERVKRYLKDSGIGEEQLLMRAAGARMPMQQERTPLAQAMNRRVAFIIEMR